MALGGSALTILNRAWRPNENPRLLVSQVLIKGYVQLMTSGYSMFVGGSGKLLISLGALLY